MPADRQTDPTDAELRTAREHRDHLVPHGPFHLYARDYPGREPAIVLLHGFPDDLHLYDRLVPELAGRRVVSFDFLGWGASDKPGGYPYTAANQTGDLDAVIQHLGFGSVVLVAHDASGPPPSTGPWTTPSGSPPWCCSTPTTPTCPGCATPGHLAILHPTGPDGRPPAVAAVRRPAVPAPVHRHSGLGNPMAPSRKVGPEREPHCSPHRGEPWPLAA
jgi:hypothetical protein